MAILAWFLDHGAELLVAAGTLALAWFTYRLARATRDAVDEGRSERDLTRKALDAANRTATAAEVQSQEVKRAADETNRTRIDQQAPRIVITAARPVWPPFIDKSRRAMPYRNELPLLDPRSRSQARQLSEDDVLSMYDDSNALLWTYIECVLVNEGESSGRVFVHGEVDSPVPHPDTFLGIDITNPRAQVDAETDYRGGEFLIRPSEALYFQWAWGAPLLDWIEAHDHPMPPNPLGKGFLQFMGEDWTRQGIVDHFFIECSCRPLIPVDRHPGYWKLNPVPDAGRAIYPTERRYVALDPDPRVVLPPWEGRYDEWAKNRGTG